MSWRLLCPLLVTLMSTPLVADQPVDFNRDIRRLISSHCLTCHGPDEAQRAADLRLDTPQGALADLGGYAAIVPGDPEASEIVVRLTSDDEDMRMPPADHGRRLNENEIALLRRWIEQGANYARHWSYEKPERPALPTVSRSDWPRNPIDYFILARLESAGLAPSPPANRSVLARRVALDLTGLPPTWEEAEAFVHDQRPGAYEQYVDQLLAKTSFGERWARVWLDLARYADSAGYADDPPRTIWAYRDYVIRSLNENKPFDQFTLEQIAGDLLPDPSIDQLTATAFHRNTLTNNEGGTNDEEFRNVAVVDRVNTTMAVWMGTTMACAQCHSHKYDPITQEEYFRFFAFFNSTADADRRDESPLVSLWSDQQLEQQAEWTARIEALKSQLATSTPELEQAQSGWLTSVRHRPEWIEVEATELTAQGRNLTSGQDGWIRASGDKQERGTYTVQIATDELELHALRLETGPEQTSNFVLTNASLSWTPAGGQAIDARFVRIEIPGTDRLLHVAEIEAFSGGENVARQGNASQSSTDYGGRAEFANDGVTGGNFNENKTTHTAKQDTPWLEIDLGAAKPIDRIVVWNRTDGGSGISERLKGFKLSLLDAQRQTVWHQSPQKVPQPNSQYAAGGRINLPLAAALADYQQAGFPASSVIDPQRDEKKGWAIGGQTGQGHELTLVLSAPRTLSSGTLTLTLQQRSVHQRHLLDQFRLAVSSDANVSQWARMPAAIRELVMIDSAELSESQRQQVAAYYRSIAPQLEPLREQRRGLEKKLRELKPYTTVPVMKELPPEQQRVTKVQLRGNYQSTTEQVDRGTPASFHPLDQDGPGDRLALARWLVDPDNPLTPRVIANRHWEQIFGIGIVETSEEFGSQGELPSHPELLDWMAAELRDGGWDLKALLKLLVTSATYQQSSVATPESIAADPQNRLLARGPRFRISAEMVRDQALFVSGLLSDKMYGPPVKPPQPQLGLTAAFGSTTDWQTSNGEDKFRRGLYTTWRRSSPYPSMAQFDAPNREVCTVRRIRTNTPLQALVTLNDPVYVEAAQGLAGRMLAAGDDKASRITRGFEISLIRRPRPEEIERLSRLVDEVNRQYAANPELAKKMATGPGSSPGGDVDPVQRAAWTVVANVILNLDEIFMKR